MLLTDVQLGQDLARLLASALCGIPWSVAGDSTFKMVHSQRWQAVARLQASTSDWGFLKTYGWVLPEKQGGSSWKCYDQGSKVTWCPFDFAHWWTAILVQGDGYRLCLLMGSDKGSSRSWGMRDIFGKYMPQRREFRHLCSFTVHSTRRELWEHLGLIKLKNMKAWSGNKELVNMKRRWIVALEMS